MVPAAQSAFKTKVPRSHARLGLGFTSPFNPSFQTQGKKRGARRTRSGAAQCQIQRWQLKSFLPGVEPACQQGLVCPHERRAGGGGGSGTRSVGQEDVSQTRLVKQLQTKHVKMRPVKAGPFPWRAAWEPAGPFAGRGRGVWAAGSPLSVCVWVGGGVYKQQQHRTLGGTCLNCVHTRGEKALGGKGGRALPRGERDPVFACP